MKNLNTLIDGISQTLHQNSVSHCFLGNIKASLRDIDIFIPKKYILLSEEKLVSFLGIRGYRFLYIKRNSYSSQIYFTDKTYSVILNIDLMPEISFRGIPYINWEDVKNRIVLNNDNICTLPESELQLYQEIKEVLLNVNGDSLNRKASNIQENRFLSILLKELKNSKFTFLRFFVIMLFKAPKNCLFGCINNLWRKVVNIFNPQGKVVCFLGPDGAGKSTQIDYLSESFFGKSIKVFYLFPGFFKRYRPQGEAQVNIDPHKRPLYSKIFSIIKLFIFSIEYILGYFFIIRPGLVKGHNVIFDRYYFDFLVDKTRYRLDVNDIFIRFFILFMPKPDVVIVLSGDPGILHDRKKEVPIEEAIRQIEKYESLKCKNLYIVNNDKDPKIAKIKIVDIIYESYNVKR